MPGPTEYWPGRTIHGMLAPFDRRPGNPVAPGGHLTRTNGQKIDVAIVILRAALRGRGWLNAVAILAVLAGCGPRNAPRGPGVEPAEPAAATAAPGGRQIPRAKAPITETLIGEMCPSGAHGRPAVMPIFVRTLSWSADESDAGAAVRDGRARMFSVFGWDGSRAGVLSVAGSTDVQLGRPVAIGSYVGRPPCVPGGAKDSTPDPACHFAQTDCGLAVAPLEAAGGFGARPFGEEPAPLQLDTGGACVVDGLLVVDIDGDDHPEAYRVEDFRGPVRAPTDEVSAVNRTAPSCKPAFAMQNVLPPGDPKHWRGLDVVGVLDLDGDGRRELVLCYHYSDRRTWAIYTADETPTRLELVGESTPWPRP